MSEPLSHLKGLFVGKLLTEKQDMAPFLVDWRGIWQGNALAVAMPDTVDDVAHIVRWWGAHDLPIVPQGGNTSLSGASIPDQTGRSIVLSLGRLNRIRAIDKMNNTMIVEAGCILQNIQDAALEVNRLFPLSLAAEGTCPIGGNLATNAGGSAVLTYVNVCELCIGLEVVTADGRIWNGLRGLRKDNTGYDLRDLFIGSEGTLGVITAAVLKLFPKPAEKATAFVALPDIGAALPLFTLAQEAAGQGLTAYEVMAGIVLDLVLKHTPGTRDPFAARHPWYALVETSGLKADGAAERVLTEVLTAAAGRGLVR